MLAGNKEEIAETISDDFGNCSRETSLFIDVAALLYGIEHTKAHLLAAGVAE
jgi:hypothetical protein